MKETHIPVIKFKRDKYGDELMVDVVTLDAIRKSKGFQKVLRQSCYGVMLTTGGSGEVEVDGVSCNAPWDRRPRPTSSRAASTRPNTFSVTQPCPSASSPTAFTSTRHRISSVHSPK